MPRRRDQAVLRSRPLHFEEVLELTCGTGGRGSAFASDGDLEAAWRQHRERLISMSHLGSRPSAYWRHEAPSELDDDHEPSLYRPTGEMAVLYHSSPYTCLPWDRAWIEYKRAERAFREARWRYLLESGELRDGEAEAIEQQRARYQRSDQAELDRMWACARDLTPPAGFRRPG